MISDDHPLHGGGEGVGGGPGPGVSQAGRKIYRCINRMAALFIFLTKLKGEYNLNVSFDNKMLNFLEEKPFLPNDVHKLKVSKNSSWG